MSAAVLAQRNFTAKGSARPAPLDVLRERAEARVYLFAIGEYELAEAVDVLQRDAVANGLVRAIGQDEVQRILSEAFGKVPR